MKATKTLGTLAISAALAMGCAAPAFATDPVETGEYTRVEADSNGVNTADTEVYVTADVKQLNVEVPLKYVIAANVNGGTATAPSASAYGIDNKGSLDVYLISAEANAEADWALSTSAFASEGTAATATKGDVYMSIQPGTVASNKFTATTGTSAKCISDSTPVTFDDKWKMPKGTKTALETKASTSVINGMAYQAQEQAFTVTYTISATAPSAGAGA